MVEPLVRVKFFLEFRERLAGHLNIRNIYQASNSRISLADTYSGRLLGSLPQFVGYGAVRQTAAVAHILHHQLAVLNVRRIKQNLRLRRTSNGGLNPAVFDLLKPLMCEGKPESRFSFLVENVRELACGVVPDLVDVKVVHALPSLRLQAMDAVNNLVDDQCAKQPLLDLLGSPD